MHIYGLKSQKYQGQWNKIGLDYENMKQIKQKFYFPQKSHCLRATPHFLIIHQMVCMQLQQFMAAWSADTPAWICSITRALCHSPSNHDGHTLPYEMCILHPD